MWLSWNTQPIRRRRFIQNRCEIRYWPSLVPYSSAHSWSTFLKTDGGTSPLPTSLNRFQSFLFWPRYRLERPHPLQFSIQEGVLVTWSYSPPPRCVRHN